VPEDLIDHLVVIDEGDQLHLSPAVRADERGNFLDLLDELAPFLGWIHQKLERNGDMREWKTIRRLLRTHCLVTTRLPLKDGRVIRIRKPSIPEAEQAKVYAHLGLDWESKCPSRKTETKKSTTL